MLAAGPAYCSSARLKSSNEKPGDKKDDKSSEAKPTDKKDDKAATTPPGSTAPAAATDPDEPPKDSVADYQLLRAVDLIRGISLYTSRAN